MSALKRFAALALLALPGSLWAIGLGGLEVRSGLNQPFDARIPIVGAEAAELADMKARLAEPDAFHRAGIARPYVLSRLRFLVVEDRDGSGYIHVTSREGIREPALEFVLEVESRSGSLQRTYSVLLEPR